MGRLVRNLFILMLGMGVFVGMHSPTPDHVFHHGLRLTQRRAVIGRQTPRQRGEEVCQDGYDRENKPDIPDIAFA